MHVVIVQPGDTLWAIARRSLPNGSSEAEIARSCAAWFAANRAVIGPDPDLILPDQHLHPPTEEHP
jgi:nucleoid-associated protein YgaU